MPFNRQLEHLTTLAKSEFREWKLYAWDRAKELERESDLFKGLPKALEIAVIGRERGLESDPRSATKPRSHGRKSG